IAAGYLIDRPLSPEGVQPADHTHAFDMYCNPFLQGATNLPADSRRLILESAAPYDLVASMMAAVILCVGGLL
ncbi:MAG: permease, partial [Pirellulaceae bacterium]